MIGTGQEGRGASPAVRVAIAAFVALTVAGYGPAAGTARAAGCGPGVLGGATVWKDRNPVYDFVAACGWHDRCYAARGYGWDALHPERAAVAYPRAWCDGGFLHAMVGACDRLRSGEPRHSLCLRVAFTFHALVRVFGGASYASAEGRRVFARLAWP